MEERDLHELHRASQLFSSSHAYALNFRTDSNPLKMVHALCCGISKEISNSIVCGIEAT
jgi:hypothetical protein